MLLASALSLPQPPFLPQEEELKSRHRVAQERLIFLRGTRGPSLCAPQMDGEGRGSEALRMYHSEGSLFLGCEPLMPGLSLITDVSALFWARTQLLQGQLIDSFSQSRFSFA